MANIIVYGRPLREERGFAPLISGKGAKNYYRYGYLACAEDAANALIGGEGINSSAMPVLFLYRHYLELALKDTLSQAGAFAIELSDRKFGHNLADLWIETQKVFADYGIEGLGPITDAVDELSELDNRADAFRYATNRDDKEHFDEFGIVDVKALLGSLKQVAEIFETLLGQMYDDVVEMNAAIRDAVERDPY